MDPAANLRYVGPVKNLYPGIKVGILGGGQLARMLAQKAQQLGLEVHVLTESRLDPAAQVAAFQIGSLRSLPDLKDFLRKVDFATFESEFLDAQLVAKAVRQSRCSLFPQANWMGRLQDRWTQKQLLAQYGIPTADFVRLDQALEAENLWKSFPTGFVIKKRLFGYDGYGTYPVRRAADLRQALKQLPSENLNCIAESLIPFRRELAISVAHNGRDIVATPLVESFQQDSRCLWVKGPVQHSRAPALLAKLKRMVRAIGYRGLMTFEIFDSGKELLVNEVAPRVHNSGHFGMNALDHDQFELHWRSVLGLKLFGPQTLVPGFAMYNLLGESTRRPQLALHKNVQLHWYGKAENRPRRKMGHLNAQGASPDKALKHLQRARKDFRL